MQEMQARLKVAGVEILDYKSAKKFFNSWIREKYKEDQREEVKAIAFRKAIVIIETIWL